MAAAVWLLACLWGGAFAATGFKQWLEDIWPEVEAFGISRTTFDMATRGLEPDLSLPDLVLSGRSENDVVKEQTEFLKPPSSYLSEPSFERLTEQGRKLAARYGQTLKDVERRFGVPGTIVMAVWGRESDYGNYRLPHNAIRVLATQAYLGRRKIMFRKEFLLGLKMLEEKRVKLDDMRSSWAGAMGLTQFLPSDFYNFGVDFDGDGKIDLWTSVPDALASAAKQLMDYGWQAGKPWGYEVETPKNFDCTTASSDTLKPLGEWLQLQFKPRRSVQMASNIRDEASVLSPAGTYGPAFLVFDNFQAIRRYNASDLYALFVGHLADRIAGGRPFETPWQNVVQLRSGDVQEMQRYLASEGYYRDSVDGRPGSKTRVAVGNYQKKFGLKVDCWPSTTTLRHMRAQSRTKGVAPAEGGKDGPD